MLRRQLRTQRLDDNEARRAAGARDTFVSATASIAPLPARQPTGSRLKRVGTSPTEWWSRGEERYMGRGAAPGPSILGDERRPRRNGLAESPGTATTQSRPTLGGRGAVHGRQRGVAPSHPASSKNHHKQPPPLPGWVRERGWRGRRAPGGGEGGAPATARRSRRGRRGRTGRPESRRGSRPPRGGVPAGRARNIAPDRRGHLPASR